jgi:hypothetical protein
MDLLAKAVASRRFGARAAVKVSEKQSRAEHRDAEAFSALLNG